MDPGHFHYFRGSISSPTHLRITHQAVEARLIDAAGANAQTLWAHYFKPAQSKVSGTAYLQDVVRGLLKIANGSFPPPLRGYRISHNGVEPAVKSFSFLIEHKVFTVGWNRSCVVCGKYTKSACAKCDVAVHTDACDLSWHTAALDSARKGTAPTVAPRDISLQQKRKAGQQLEEMKRLFRARISQQSSAKRPRPSD